MKRNRAEVVERGKKGGYSNKVKAAHGVAALGTKNGKRSHSYTISDKARKRAASKPRIQIAEQPAKAVPKPPTFPRQFPFWAWFKVGKKRRTLVIDETVKVYGKEAKAVEHYVHRELTHTADKGFEEIPNPVTGKTERSFLRSPRVHPKRVFAPLEKSLPVSESLASRYARNDKKGK